MTKGEVKESGRLLPFEFVIEGEPASKANSRKFARIGGVPRFIKSAKALSYLQAFGLQCPVLNPLFEGDVHVELEIFYASRRPDLDESVVLDAMQGRIYRNDRQVKKKTVSWGLDRLRPRASVRISPLEACVGSGDT